MNTFRRWISESVLLKSLSSNPVDGVSANSTIVWNNIVMFATLFWISSNFQSAFWKSLQQHLWFHCANASPASQQWNFVKFSTCIPLYHICCPLGDYSSIELRIIEFDLMPMLNLVMHIVPGGGGRFQWRHRIDQVKLFADSIKPQQTSRMDSPFLLFQVIDWLPQIDLLSALFVLVGAISILTSFIRA